MIHPYEEQDFKKFGEFFDTFYDKYNRVKKYHIFTCKREDIKPGSIMVSAKEFDSDNAQVLNQNILKSDYLGCKDFKCEEEAFKNRAQKMKDNPAPIIPEAGLNPYKVYMLWKQHRDLLPVFWQDKTCPAPTTQQLSKVKREKVMREERNTEIKKMKREKTKERQAQRMSSDFQDEDDGHSV